MQNNANNSNVKTAIEFIVRKMLSWYWISAIVHVHAHKHIHPGIPSTEERWHNRQTNWCCANNLEQEGCKKNWTRTDEFVNTRRVLFKRYQSYLFKHFKSQTRDMCWMDIPAAWFTTGPLFIIPWITRARHLNG